MSFLFVISNGYGHFYSKQKAWTDGRQPTSIYRARHYDEALNTLLELNAKDIGLRVQVIETETDDRGEPIVTISDIPLPVTETEVGTSGESEEDTSVEIEAVVKKETTVENEAAENDNQQSVQSSPDKTTA